MPDCHQFDRHQFDPGAIELVDEVAFEQGPLRGRLRQVGCDGDETGLGRKGASGDEREKQRAAGHGA